MIYQDYECGDYDPDEWDERCEMFADPGGDSALRAETPDNPRNLPCPSCGAEDVLTPADRAQGYNDVKVTVRTDNDPSCNTYTYEDTTRVPVLTQSLVTDLIQQALNVFRETHPHNHNVPVFPPVQVSVTEARDAVSYHTAIQALHELTDDGSNIEYLRGAVELIADTFGYRGAVDMDEAKERICRDLGLAPGSLA